MEGKEGVDFGIVFDIDGVIYRGGKLIPGARETIQKVQKLGIPHLFFTNNGMETEAMRANHLSKILDLQLCKENFILCHSALKKEAEEIGEGLALVTGYSRLDPVDLMKTIGFKNVHSIDEYASCHPELNPLCSYETPKHREWADDAVEMIVLLERSMNWSQDIQVVCDLMMYHGYPFPQTKRTQKPKLISCNFDMTYMDSYKTVRLGPGAFVLALSTIYKELTNGEDLEFIRHGKPHAPMYRVAERRLQNQVENNKNLDLRRIYAIGDNPHSDIRGANQAGDHWTSILVKTGCFQSEENDPIDPADHIAKDISEAVQYILSIEMPNSSQIC